MIPFNKPLCLGTEERHVSEAIAAGILAGGGPFTRRCETWLENRTGARRVLLTSSCTHALEMAAILSGVGPGDEVIAPSFTFVSTANAFALRGASLVFVDVDPVTMCIDAERIEEAITERTRVIVVVHYAGVACDLDRILGMARARGVMVVEDAAQALGSTHGGRALGTFGQLGTVSFHETKNLTSGGEGGALFINDASLVDRAEIIREKGTNRRAFSRGMVDKYSWVDVGSSYLASELQAAYLWGQLDHLERIIVNRRSIWDFYHDRLAAYRDRGRIETSRREASGDHNAHLFFIKLRDAADRTALIHFFDDRGILAVFHYVPLHSSLAGTAHGRFAGEDRHTTVESERLLRLPLYFGLSTIDQEAVMEALTDYLEKTA